MDVFASIATRHSTRKYQEQMLSDDALKQILDAGRQAPSGKRQNLTHYLVVRKPEVLQKLTDLVQQEFAKMEVTPENQDDYGGAIKAAKKGNYNFRYNAPVLVILANKIENHNAMADVACAMQDMMLAANALDVGSCWINQLRWLQDNPVLRDYLHSLGMAEDERVYASLDLGYADTPDGLPNRKVIEDIKGNPVDYID